MKKLITKIFMYVSLMIFAFVLILVMKEPWKDPIDIIN